jgi:hypothetical protein
LGENEVPILEIPLAIHVFFTLKHNLIPQTLRIIYNSIITLVCIQTKFQKRENGVLKK